jgi:hypothetical protein
MALRRLGGKGLIVINKQRQGWVFQLETAVP